jgi:pyruvate carboxylase subunit B
MSDSTSKVPAAGPRNYIITVNNQTYNVTVALADGSQAPAAGGITVAPVAAAAPEKIGTDVEAPTPGSIMKVLVEVGENVVVNQPLLVMEAMKMESEVNSPCAGKVLAIHVAAGDAVQASEPLITIG